MKFNSDTQLLLCKFSHEIRNPLTTLYSTIQLIEQKYPETHSFPYWESIHYDIEYIDHLLTNFSNLAKSEKLNLEIFDLRSTLERLSLSFAASVADSEVEYSSTIDSSITQITGDKTKLQEVIWNLLKNALDAVSSNGHIYFSAKQEENKIHLSVKDTGCGIPEDLLSNIFEPFVTYKKHGNGLGLAICKHIVTAHGGTISVTSSVDAGTTFHVVLKTNQNSYYEPTNQSSNMSKIIYSGTDKSII